ncbi:MAG: TIGR03960 family B12-binding radical SAM protein, partial [Desulfamplus sp.]|nr:TIGR03960 family B12-binding radical SAM protein [Desulfamplus sp.]
FPLIIAGGPCTFNPEPLADFFDAFVIGDGEKVILDISNAFIQWKKDGNRDKKNLLKRLSNIQGVYVPSFFKASYNEKGIQQLELLPEWKDAITENKRIKRAILPDIATTPFPTSPVVPFGKPVHDRLRLEIARGCSRGCRFCQAGMIYRPVRERSVEDLVDITKEALKNTGYSDLSLLSLSTGDYGNLAPLMEQLMAINCGYPLSISLPSVRAGKLNTPLMKIIKKVKKTGFTIAPEAGSQRLRDVINKNITEEDIFNTVNSAFALGWRNIKLYFMNGLPTETDEDIQAIADMARRLATIKTSGKGKSTISISFASFIPKPHTPFQRCAQIHPDKAMENLNFLKQQLRHPGINIKWQHPKMSLLEGVWARGDRRLAKLLVKAWANGCRLDGWSDMFRFDLWQQSFDECCIDPYFYTTRERERDETLPWEHIDCGISDKFMESEFNKSIKGELTYDCREDGCTGCGICDFKTIQPVLHDAVNQDLISPASSQKYQATQPNIYKSDIDKPAIPNLHIDKNIDENSSVSDDTFSKITIFYSRVGKAKHFGHLELAKIIRRAIRRTGLQVRYSTGFSPAMKISFDNPLPVGMESEEEFFSIHANLSAGLGDKMGLDYSVNSYIKSDIKLDEIVVKLNDVLPRSIIITGCVRSQDLQKRRTSDTVLTSYRINLKTFSITQKSINEFMSLSEYVLEKLSFKGIQRSTDLRKVIKSITLINPLTIDKKDESLKSTQLEMTLKNDGQRTIRPSEILIEVFQVPDAILHAADILKLKIK